MCTRKLLSGATSATPLPMWDVEGSGMVPYQIWYLISVTVAIKLPSLAFEDKPKVTGRGPFNR
jgi:hypothetical protein